ncbi:MAG: DUF2306 domain-containing protein [Micrococcales bacterium]|nr:DUF2306 domain-containing protein [Micrococcales bacterium]
MPHHLNDATAVEPQTPTRPSAPTGWLAICGLLVLSALPIIGGALSLRDVASGSGSPLTWVATAAIVAHIVSMSVFCLVGAFQFSPALRSRRAWHRRAGRMLIPIGFLAALSGAWLAIFFRGPDDEYPLAVVRLVFSAAMAAFLALSVRAIAQRDFRAHAAWSIRAFAIAVSGGTQALVAILWAIPFGEADAAGETWVVAAGFLINLGVAELIIRRRRADASRQRAGRGALVS